MFSFCQTLGIHVIVVAVICVLVTRFSSMSITSFHSRQTQFTNIQYGEFQFTHAV